MRLQEGLRSVTDVWLTAQGACGQCTDIGGGAHPTSCTVVENSSPDSSRSGSRDVDLHGSSPSPAAGSAMSLGVLLSSEADTGSTLSVAVRLEASCAREELQSSSIRPTSAAKPFPCDASHRLTPAWIPYSVKWTPYPQQL